LLQIFYEHEYPFVILFWIINATAIQTRRLTKTVKRQILFVIMIA